jgi:hypothetical protein
MESLQEGTEILVRFRSFWIRKFSGLQTLLASFLQGVCLCDLL